MNAPDRGGRDRGSATGSEKRGAAVNEREETGRTGAGTGRDDTGTGATGNGPTAKRRSGIAGGKQRCHFS